MGQPGPGRRLSPDPVRADARGQAGARDRGRGEDGRGARRARGEGTRLSADRTGLDWAKAIGCWAVALPLGLLALVLAVAPRAIGGPDQEAEGRELRVMTANLRFGSGDEGALARLARDRDVDLLAIQELTFDAVAELKLAGLAGELPHAALSARE